ncbi:MAG: von Willebrand factor type A domain-containing protein [Flavobacteriaceae bacterium]
MQTLITFIFSAFVATMSIAQEKKITGIVSDESGLPLPGTSIIVKGTSTGTQTDFDGKYEILANIGETLVFSYVGYKRKEIVVGALNIINITMEFETAVLEEVVVTAQGIRKQKKALGYAVSEVKAEQIERRKEADVARVLSGKASGVQITSASGTTGSATNVVIRGYSSISGNNQALFVVDGVPYNGNQTTSKFLSLDPEDIKEVNVLKGLAAASLYGTAGRNGVIVITTKNGNYTPKQIEQNNEAYEEIIENDFENVLSNPLSTFSIDVDKASYSNIRRMINNAQPIPQDAVKIEEMINYFNYKYEQPKNVHPFAIHSELIKTPWNSNTKLVKIGLQGKTYENDALPASNLTFLIDVSGSMSNQNKLPLLKSAFKLLVNQLREKDKVSIVVYAGAAGVVLEPTSGHQKDKILRALDNLQAGGSTAGGAGIKLAYKLAEENFKKGGNNRVILATDGDFNVGASSDKDMKELIEEKRKSGVFLSVLGFGYGNYKDSKLEALADKGNGNHAYIDSMSEAQKVFGKEFGGTLFTIAKDVKIQVEFNPSIVKAYRLIGYENRLLNDEDFIDDTIDAGELGSGHTVTALYEIIPVGIESNYMKEVNDLKYTNNVVSNNFGDELLTVKFRYKKPDGDKSIEMEHVQSNYEAEPSEDINFAAAVALFGMQLKHSKYHNDSKIEDVLELARKGKGEDEDGYRAEFIRLVSLSQTSK